MEFLKMELPEDVLTIIRQYAKPCFKYFREYNRTVQVVCKNRWPLLKQMLQQNGDKIVPILLPYLDAYVKSNQLRQDLFDFVTPLKHTHPALLNKDAYFIERERQVELFWETRKIEDDLYCALVKEVYGT